MLGGLVLLAVEGRYLPLVGAALISLAWVCAETAHRFIRRSNMPCSPIAAVAPRHPA